MKASELITALQDAIQKHGDLPVTYFDHEWHCHVTEVDLVDSDRGLELRLDGDRA